MYFFVDDYGLLYLLMINMDGVEVKGMVLIKIGVMSRVSELVYLGNEMLFVVSYYGDLWLF